MKVSTVGMIAVAAAAIATPIYAESIFDNSQIAEAWNAATSGFSVVDRNQLTVYANDAVALLGSNSYTLDVQKLETIPDTFKKLIDFFAYLLDQCADEEAVGIPAKLDSCESELRLGISNVVSRWPSRQIDAVDALLTQIFDIAKEFNAALPNVTIVVNDIGHAASHGQDAFKHVMNAIKDLRELTDSDHHRDSQSSSSILDSVENNVPVLSGNMDFFCGATVDSLIAGTVRYLNILKGDLAIAYQFRNVSADIWELIDKRYFPARDQSKDRALVIDMIENLNDVGSDLVPAVRDVWTAKNGTCEMLTPQFEFVLKLVPDMIAEIKILMEKIPTPQPSSATQTSALIASVVVLMALFQ